MPESRALVDAEAVIIAHLSQDAGLLVVLDSPAVGEEPIASELDETFPEAGEKFVQVFRATATSIDPETGFLERVVLQVNSYGSSKGEAWDVIAETARALIDARTADHDGCAVTAVERLTGPSWSRDPSTAAPRYTSSWAVTVHPA